MLHDMAHPRGHGTYVDDGNVVSSVAGTIQRVNKLVSVKPIRARYTPQVGDLVIGRIVEVGSSRWKVDGNARQDAVLMLSSVNLPGGVQVRWQRVPLHGHAMVKGTHPSEGRLNRMHSRCASSLPRGMCVVYLTLTSSYSLQLLVAEVQAFFADGAMSLHTRSLKYGKVCLSPSNPPALPPVPYSTQLRNGQLVVVPPHLIRRLKSHFHHLPPPCGPSGVDMILGLNGYVWVSVGTDQEKREGGEGFDAEGVYSNKNDVSFPLCLRLLYVLGYSADSRTSHPPTEQRLPQWQLSSRLLHSTTCRSPIRSFWRLTSG